MLALVPVVTLALIAFPLSAAAYVDPGLGGQLFQTAYLLVIGVLGFVVAPAFFFGRKIGQMFRRVTRRRSVEPAPAAPPDTPSHHIP